MQEQEINQYKDSIKEYIKEGKGFYNQLSNKKFYKFRPINKNTIDMILRDKIYFSNQESLNDPLDCPIMNANDEALSRLFENTNSNKGADGYHPKILSLVRYENETETEFENINNLLMFSHYANSHQGICIEYEFDPNFVDKKMAYAEVEYQDSLQTKNIINWFAIKSHLWSYEKEVRFISFGKYNLLNLKEKGRVNKIIFGCECKDDDKELIKEIIKGKNIELYQAKKKSIDTQSIKDNSKDYFKFIIECHHIK